MSFFNISAEEKNAIAKAAFTEPNPIFRKFAKAMSNIPSLSKTFQEFHRSTGAEKVLLTNPLHKAPLPMGEGTNWKKSVLLCGEYGVGKTTLCLNSAYWRVFDSLEGKDYQFRLWDTSNLIDFMEAVKKVGPETAANNFCGFMDPEDFLEDAMLAQNPTFPTDVIILDDFNLNALGSPQRAHLASELVMHRYLAGTVTWVVSNEPLSVFSKSFPRLFSRITENKWQVLDLAK